VPEGGGRATHSMKTALSTTEILATLREVNAAATAPLWLFGGVAVDFLVGRWTRPHGDIDLNALARHRGALTEQLGRIGYRTADTGWLTQWFQDGTGRRLEIVFLEETADGAVELVIRAGDPVGVPGRYPIVPGYLDPARTATLEEVTFRVGSPAGEWLARAAGTDVVGGRPVEPKLAHDRRLLETLLSADERERLRRWAASARTG